MLKIIENAIGIQHQQDACSKTDPAQVRTAIEDARFLREDQSQADQRSASQSDRHRPDPGEIVRSVEVKKTADHNGKPSDQHRERPPVSFRASQTQYPQAYDEK